MIGRVPQGQMVKQQLYVEVLRKLREGCTIWDCKRYWSPENSRNDPKNSHRTAFQGIILDTADNESLLSNCQTIIRPSGLKEEQFDTWFGSAVIPGFVL
ncbi:hypothetical protein TNCT_616121 [Trichonephila clavata]|uniref:Uncharacterized protein n=1 Tax=Trichonephila clavata TaxID=2740835 RepID=A0A8X6IEC7_TRICU|nr:hypothetical protein TNCT_616121 [Trichonephila clavata]